jgi:hypothetical protein
MVVARDAIVKAHKAISAAGRAAIVRSTSF